jgi:hypothetical protein
MTAVMYIAREKKVYTYKDKHNKYQFVLGTKTVLLEAVAIQLHAIKPQLLLPISKTIQTTK